MRCRGGKSARESHVLYCESRCHAASSSLRLRAEFSIARLATRFLPIDFDPTRRLLACSCTATTDPPSWTQTSPTCDARQRGHAAQPESLCSAVPTAHDSTTPTGLQPYSNHGRSHCVRKATRARHAGQRCRPRHAVAATRDADLGTQSLARSA
jgi:hypothetical protein